MYGWWVKQGGLLGNGEWRIIALIAGLPLFGCGRSGTSTPPASNECGGTVELTFDGRPAQAGDACGMCGDGLVICVSPSALGCLGATSNCEPGDGGSPSTNNPAGGAGGI